MKFEDEMQRNMLIMDGLLRAVKESDERHKRQEDKIAEIRKEQSGYRG